MQGKIVKGDLMKIKTDILLPIQARRLSVSKLPMPKSMKFVKKSKPNDIFPNFKKGYSAFGMNNGSFSFMDLIRYILKQTGPAHALVSSWVASSKSVKKILNLLDNENFLSVRFLLDRMFANTRPEIHNFIINKFGANCIRTSRLHMKFCVLYNDDWSVVIETSANLNKNIRLETFRVTENKAFSEFFKEFFDNIFNLSRLKITLVMQKLYLNPH